MKRSQFFLVSSVIAGLFGISMLTMPAQLAANWGVPPSDAANLFIRMLGMNILIFGVMNYMVRAEANSTALKAIITGNLLLHGLGLGLDWYGYSTGVLVASAMIPAFIVHIALGGGFLFYLLKVNKEPSSARAYAN